MFRVKALPASGKDVLARRALNVPNRILAHSRSWLELRRQARAATVIEEMFRFSNGLYLEQQESIYFHYQPATTPKPRVPTSTSRTTEKLIATPG